jgi:hypothetical protein
MTAPRRGVDLPAIPIDGFVPDPARLRCSAEWGVSVMTADRRRYQAETSRPNLLWVDGLAIEWHSAGNGTGVHYGRAVTVYGASFAVARAVPLS